MRNTLVTTLSASMLVLAAVMAVPTSAQSQVVVIIGNGGGQPYYPQPYVAPYSQPTVVYSGGYYPGYAYRPYGYGYYNGYYGVGYGYARPWGGYYRW